MPSSIQGLSHSWMVAKRREREAIEERRSIEDQLAKIMEIDETKEGTVNLVDNDVRVRVTSRLNRKIDSQKLQDIAAEHGISDHLPTLFRWKPEIDMRTWRNADESITKPLLDAITTVPSRPSFQIKGEGE